MKPRTKLFISTDAVEGVFGEGKWRLLGAIKKEGSIQKAALSLGRGYRKAWGDIKLAEKGLGRKMVETGRGGASGGSAVLTGFSEDLLKAWGAYRTEIFRQSDKAFEKYLKRLLKEK